MADLLVYCGSACISAWRLLSVATLLEEANCCHINEACHWQHCRVLIIVMRARGELRVEERLSIAMLRVSVEVCCSCVPAAVRTVIREGKEGEGGGSDAGSTTGDLAEGLSGAHGRTGEGSASLPLFPRLARQCSARMHHRGDGRLAQRNIWGCRHPEPLMELWTPPGWSLLLGVVLLLKGLQPGALNFTTSSCKSAR